MHELEPHFRWRDLYIASNDKRSPFYGRKYSEFEFTHSLYNFYLHPQWDEFGSSSLYGKILFADYVEGYALIELIGEWNDTLHEDIMWLKRNVADVLMKEGIFKFVFFCENILIFHSGEDEYYAEWAEEVREENGWIVLLNIRQHIEEEMLEARLQQYMYFGENYNDINWQTQKPAIVFSIIDAMVNGRIQRLSE